MPNKSSLSIVNRFRSSSRRGKINSSQSRRRKMRAELLEDRRLLAVGDLIGSVFPLSQNGQASTREGFA
jgi:hypothetical protein